MIFFFQDTVFSWNIWSHLFCVRFLETLFSRVEENFQFWFGKNEPMLV